MTPNKYPLGIQTFSEIREKNQLYIDKTEYIYRMTHGNMKYAFLSRPRRFGKSLLVSTLKSYFEGKKELFKGLAIEKLETEWEEFPVLHFSMAGGKHMEKDTLERYLDQRLMEQEDKFGVKNTAVYPNVRLAHLIRHIYQKTGKQVVVLIDEYDAPLLDVVHEDEHLVELRQVMRNFYSPLKDADPYLRFVFLTGITKFSQASIFSELNNINNISMLPEYAGLCGITKDELETQMQEDVAYLGKRLGKIYEETMENLRSNYDGYHFAWPSPDVFNPFSLLAALTNGELDAYWFSTGTPTYLLEMLRKFDVKPNQLSAIQALKSDFDAPTENMQTVIPLLYQSGYLTIKDYNSRVNFYTLDIPNKEISEGLFRNLLPNYVDGVKSQQGGITIAKMADKILQDDMEEAMQLLQDFLSTVPYCNVKNYEEHYQQMLFIIFTLLTPYVVDVEVHTPHGRIDMVLMTKTRIYIMELKLNRDAKTAMRQINLKDYRKRFSLSNLPITKVGVNFDSEKGNIDDWEIVDERRI
mgnify:FL=1